MTMVLLSGGLDSTVAAAMLKHEHEPHLEAVSIDYGQRHIRELAAAHAVARHLDIEHVHAPLGDLGQALTSALTTTGVDVPHGHYTDRSMAATVVPGRNLIFAAIAVGVATSRGHDKVVLGVHAGDHPIYPDCRTEFIACVDAACRTAYGTHVLAPFIDKTKTDIVALGARVDAPMCLTWSCYEGGDLHCGRCGTCVERAESFHEAGVPDPTQYHDDTFWREQVAA